MSDEKPDKSEKTSSKPNHMSVENKVIDFVADFITLCTNKSKYPILKVRYES